MDYRGMFVNQVEKFVPSRNCVRRRQVRLARGQGRRDVPCRLPSPLAPGQTMDACTQ